MQTFNQLKKNLKYDFSALKPVKVALLGDTATQFLVQAIRGAGYDAGLNIQTWEADFDQIERQVYDPSSELYTFKPEIVILFHSTHKLLKKYNSLPMGEQANLSTSRMELISKVTRTLIDRMLVNIIYYNYTEIDDAVFGNYANKVTSSFLFQLRKLNYDLMVFASGQAGFYLCDLSSIQNRFGKPAFFHPPVYISTEMVLSLDVLPDVAAKTIDIISALQGVFKKCLIIDLDNTIWGGIIGDDGVENIQLGELGIGKAFTELQHWIKKLVTRGIIIAVCSKNTESIAREPFERHPDMVLQLSDIAVFVANWETKVDNIRQIQNILNIGFESMVFLDDNPFERNIVRENITGITVPELPEDPAEYLEYLYQLNLFETISLSGEDAERTKRYQVEASRSSLQKSFINEDEFLKSLDMFSRVESFNKFNGPRAAQLSQRSNQFNLRTVRYTEADLESMSVSEDMYSFSFTLEDKFGDNGLICVIILRREDENTLFIDSWFMSCRVLKRGMEQFALNTIVNFAAGKGYSYLKGEYIPTPKNGMVKDHYFNLGFKTSGNFWVLDINGYVQRKCFIQLK